MLQISWRWMVVGMGGFLIAACAAESTPSTPPNQFENGLAPGIHQETLEPSGRRYTISIPAGYTGEEAVPLVVALHFGGTVTPFYGRNILEGLVEPALEELGAIIVAPDSVAGGWANTTSETHVLELLDFIEANYNIDSDKVLLTGYSLGGMGTWYLAPRNQERFTAAIPIAGRPQGDSLDFEWQIPLYAIQGAADELISVEPTEAAVAELAARGANVELVVLDGFGHYETNRYVEPLRAAVPWLREVWGK